MSLLFRAWLCSLLMVLQGCSFDDGRPLKIATNLWPGYEPLYLAQNIGAYGGEAEVIQLASATEVMRALRHGSIDGAGLTMDETLTLMSQGTDLVVLLALDFSRGGDAILGMPNSGVFSLRGKRVGVENTAVGSLVLSEALIQGQVELDEIDVVNISADQHESALLNGKVDFVVTFEPAKSRLLGAGARVLFDTTQAPELVVDVLVVRRDGFKKRRQAVISLLRGYYNARAYMNTNRSESMGFFSKRLKLDEEQIQESFAGLHLPTLQENMDWFSGEPSAYEHNIHNTMAILRQRKIVTNEFKLVVYSDATWLQEVAR